MAKRKSRPLVRKSPHRVSRAKELRFENIEYELNYFKNHLEKIWEHVAVTNDRLQDLEIRINIITRVLVGICTDHLGIKSRHLRRMIRAAEKDIVSASQINELEKLFRLEPREGKNTGEDKNGTTES